MKNEDENENFTEINLITTHNKQKKNDICVLKWRDPSKYFAEMHLNIIFHPK